jgi:capsular polysaccharide biosynthesis protein
MAMSEQPLDLKRFLKLFWRGRLIVAVFVIVGFLCGVAHVVLRPPPPTARALVVIPTASITTAAGATVDDAPTQIIIATSTPVLAAAGAAVSPPISPTTLRRHIAVTALSADVLQFQVNAPSGAEAEKLANAAATGYVAYINETSTMTAGGALSSLRGEASSLSSQIESLQHQMNAAATRLAGENPDSAAGQRDATLIGSLRTEQQEVSLQLNSVNNEIVSSQLSGSLSAQATRVLQSATLVPTSKVQLAFYPVAGGVVGFLLGGLFIFFRSRRDRRLRYRDELASAINLPVLASIECERCRSVKDWKHLLESYQPSPVDLWNFRRLVHRLMADDAPELVQINLIAFASDTPALAVSVEFARCAAELGIETQLVPGEHPSLASFRAACALLGPAGVPDGSYGLEGENRDEDFSAVRLALVVVAVDEGHPVPPVSEGASLLAVSAGYSNGEALARVALAATDSGHTIAGIVVVNPDPTDSTAGVVPMGGELRPLTHHNPNRTSPDRTVGQLR